MGLGARMLQRIRQFFLEKQKPTSPDTLQKPGSSMWNCAKFKIICQGVASKPSKNRSGSIVQWLVGPNSVSAEREIASLAKDGATSKRDVYWRHRRRFTG